MSEKKKPISLKIMPDFCSSGIWDGMTDVMVDYEELDLPKDLIIEFKNWIDFFDNNSPPPNYCPLKDKLPEINKRGEELSKKLKKFLPDTEVLYVGEGENSILLAKKIEITEK